MNLNLYHQDIADRSSSLKRVSKLTSFDSNAPSWKDWALKFENMAVSVVQREFLDWAAQMASPILTVDDVDAGLVALVVNPQIYFVLADFLEGDVQNTARGAGLKDWRKLERRFDPQRVGRKRTLLSRVVSPGAVWSKADCIRCVSKKKKQ